MKPRIEKKLSKRLVAILVNHPRLLGDVWIDNEYERYVSLWRGVDKPPATPGEVRRYYEAKARVNHVPSVGGGSDYWGEGQDHFTVYAAYKEHMYWTAPEVEARFKEGMKGWDAALDAIAADPDSLEPIEPGPSKPFPMGRRLTRPTGADVIQHALALPLNTVGITL